VSGKTARLMVTIGLGGLRPSAFGRAVRSCHASSDLPNSTALGLTSLEADGFGQIGRQEELAVAHSGSHLPRERAYDQYSCIHSNYIARHAVYRAGRVLSILAEHNIFLLRKVSRYGRRAWTASGPPDTPGWPRRDERRGSQLRAVERTLSPSAWPQRQGN